MIELHNETRLAQPEGDQWLGAWRAGSRPVTGGYAAPRQEGALDECA